MGFFFAIYSSKYCFEKGGLAVFVLAGKNDTDNQLNKNTPHLELNFRERQTYINALLMIVLF